ncbi:thioredoxin reductase [Desulfolithobacter dissulfuricans]|uniref:Thioredoxin reductase n=1 Tax=Desulfolithobacter dissulfuricans TaxID=2795293 RepID=A0A915XJE0_9BACT|nr:thioredoxin-disulfide reductase [Desulfolithobacter dissulfuricans]BCO10195.1 thioredoxin reductase [Desulfolithobacter dissulfuricans]
MLQTDYKLIIVGGGPAGLTAGLYAARGRLEALLLEKGAVGGQVLLTDWVDNYPGFVEGLSGFDLIEKMTAHADRFGVEKKLGTVQSMDLQDTVKTLHLDDGSTLTTLAVILCTGARPNKLGVPGEKEFAGRGVSYCATCDGPFYRNQQIAVVGGGNTAIQEAIHLTKFASRVTVIHRRDTLRATKILQEKAFANDKIDFIWNTTVEAIEGGDSGVERLRLAHADGSTSFLEVSGIFILIGVVPNNEMLPQDQLHLDKQGFVLTDTEMLTNLPGVFAAGDIRSKNFRQIINAAGDGATAELSAEQYLGSLR